MQQGSMGQIDGDAFAHFWVFVFGISIVCSWWLLTENFGLSSLNAALTSLAIAIPTGIYGISRLAASEAKLNAQMAAEERAAEQAAASTPAAARSFGNVPLSQQTPASGSSANSTPASRTFGNVPLSQQ